VGAGIAAWITLIAVTGAFRGEQYAAVLGVGTSACFYAAAAVEFRLARGEPLQGRRPIIAVIGAQAIAVFLLALQFASATDFIPVPSISRCHRSTG
jgi:hypothetical protein